jgi:hypothetical protein
VGTDSITASYGGDTSFSGSTSSPVSQVVNSPTSSLATGIEAYWKFDEGSGTTTSDSSGHGSTGTTHGSNIWTPSGKINAGLQLGGPGSTNYVSTSLPVTTSGPVTYAGWANRADSLGSYGLLGSSASGGTGPLIQIPSGTNSIKFWRHTSGVSTVFNNAVPTPGTWFQWALVDDPTAQTTTLYINGASVGTNSYTATGATAGNVEIGGYAGTSSLFKGLIDEVGVWNRALTATEVTTLYNGGTGLQYPFS